MKIVLWISLLGILYTYMGYPFVMWLRARVRPWPWRAADFIPSVSIVMAVHNGAALLPQKMRHLLELDYPNIREIIVVSDGSTDGTAELLTAMTDLRVKSILLREHRGKAIALNAGMVKASADVILFVDIRPEIAPGAIQRLVSNFSDKRIGCVSGNLLLRGGGHDGTAAAVGGLYWRYEQWLRTCEAATDSTVGVYGGFYAVRRELAAIQPDGIILDDMFQPLSIIRSGYRTVIDSSAYVFDTWPTRSEDEFHRKVRTLAGNFQLIQLAPWVLTPQNRVFVQLISHKIMRLVVPYLFVLLFVSTVSIATASAFYAAFAALQVSGWTMAICGALFKLPWLNRVTGSASALLVLNTAAVVALYRFIFTPRPLWRIWLARNSMEMKADFKI